MGQYFKKLPGKKVYLSPIDPDDAPVFTGWLADLEVTEFLTLAPRIIGVAQEREFLTKMAQGQDDFVIVETSTDRPLGACGFVGVDLLHRHAEVGIFLGEKEFWGRGYGSEALALLLDFGFRLRNLHNIMLRVKLSNRRAIRAYEKLGFRSIGIRRQAQVTGETYHDLLFMDLLSSEFTGKISEEQTL